MRETKGGGPFFKMTAVKGKIMTLFFWSLMFMLRRLPRFSWRVASERYGDGLAHCQYLAKHPAAYAGMLRTGNIG
jgi:hypothetical protein